MGLWVGHLAGDQGTGFNPNSLSFCPLSVFLATLCAVCLDGHVFEGRDMPFRWGFVDFSRGGFSWPGWVQHCRGRGCEGPPPARGERCLFPGHTSQFSPFGDGRPAGRGR